MTLLKYLHIIVHVKYNCTMKFKHNVCLYVLQPYSLKVLTSYHLETLFIPAVSIICSKEP